ncbi:hypothetical protein IEO21_11049 [Rhodonia placenta]|uniref:Uncharacterized protein n=1 Tax=Rhodonia placenta TaxID=104341 RepID=A0A8H7TWR6_9APHY|nr:hypothetical protein IEO21_11049 [Postia placenta]
MLTRPRGT